MELKILGQEEKILLSRKEIKAKVHFTGAIPSKSEIKKALVSQLKADDNLVIIKSISTHFKANSIDVLVYQYINKEDMKKIEIKTKEEAKPKEEVKEEGK